MISSSLFNVRTVPGPYLPSSVLCSAQYQTSYVPTIRLQSASETTDLEAANADWIVGSDISTYPSLLDITVDELAAYLKDGAITSVDLVNACHEICNSHHATC